MLVPDRTLSHLDDGEAQAIALALEHRADLLLLDERDGTAAARARGLTVTGTLGTLDRAASLGMVDLPTMFFRLGQTTFHSPVRLMATMLEQDALKGVEVTRVNQVRSTDITYVRMAGGFVYLVAVMDWQFVLSWALSVTMELDFCVEALKRALRRGRPEIFNSDQGSQFTSEKFIGELETQGITISMDGRGRCFDNIFMERLWRSLKYEEIYLRDYQLVPEARAGIGNWFRFYNQQRPHQSLGYRTPAELYLG